MTQHNNRFQRAYASSSQDWVLVPKPNPRASLRLFCFPYAGGGASIYMPWARQIAPLMEVCIIQLPGREQRMSEAPYTQMQPLVEALAAALLPWLYERPFAFFGHSMGALISNELVHALYRQHGMKPAHLFVAAHAAPHVPPRRAPIHALPDDEFVAELRRLNGTPEEVLQHPELLRLVLPALRADFALCETYCYEPREPLPCSLSAWGGLHDADVPRTDLSAWREHTHAAFRLRMFPGDHFFLHTERMLVLQTLARELNQVAPMMRDS
jgi:medium-chain acyl-[acyl-carrier-protein] hydrolase